MAADAFGVEIDYLPAASGSFMWQAYERGAVERDLAAIATARIPVIRVGLAWDSFMPDDSGVDGRRIAELDHLLRTAMANSLRVVPVLFVQSTGDCVQLPAYTVLRRRPRRGVRVLSDGRVEPGGPRDVWTDPLMVELSDRWLRRLLAAFGGHPAIAAWDLGEDPAATVRPRRIADLRRWVAMHAATLRDAGAAVRLTLGGGDVTTARGVRLDGLDVDRLDVRAGDSDVLFTAAVAARLAGRAVGLGVAMPAALPSGDEPEPSDARPGRIEEIVERRDEAGLMALRIHAWSDLDDALAGRPPYDRADQLRRCGLVTAAGPQSALATVSRLAIAEPAAAAGPGWPAALDAASWYAGLPDSLRDLEVMWQRDSGASPDILGGQ